METINRIADELRRFSLEDGLCVAFGAAIIVLMVAL